MQSYVYPSGSAASANASVGPTGTTAPASATEIAGVGPTGLLTPVSVDASGKVNVILSTATIEIGKVDQGAPNTDPNAWPIRITDGTHDALVSAAGAQLVDGSAVTQPVSAASLPLPTGASTSALQTSGNTSLSSIATNTAGIPSTITVPGTPAADAVTVQGNASGVPIPVSISSSVLSSVNVSQYGGVSTSLGQKVSASSVPVTIASDDTVAISAASLPLPAGAATSALQSTISGQLPATLGQKASAASLAVVLASNQSSIPVTSTANGSVPLQFVRNVYSSTNVTTGAYVQLIASTSGVANVAEIFDSSGQTLAIAFGAIGSEVQKFIVYPGGNGRMTLAIPAATRVSIIALSATASAGEIDLNLYT